LARKPAQLRGMPDARRAPRGGKHSPLTPFSTGKKLPLQCSAASTKRATVRLLPRGTVVAQAGCGPFAASRISTMESILGVHEAALLYRARRTEVLAANLANADTPRYQARDLTFAAVLDDRMSAARRLAVTDDRHMRTDPLSSRESLQYRVPHQPSLDGNTVEADLELARYAENAVSYQATLLFASGKISTLRSALTGSR
jgi:flagellar basal-body rod protein FlgB